MPRVTLANRATAAEEKLSSRERGSASPPSHAQLRHAQQFSILSAIFCSTELVVCIELVFIFPNMIYKHNHVSDFDIALGCKAGMHPGPRSAGEEHHSQGGAFCGNTPNVGLDPALTNLPQPYGTKLRSGFPCS